MFTVYTFMLQPLPEDRSALEQAVEKSEVRYSLSLYNNKIIIIHKFSIALFPAERAQRACSHTCT